MGSRTKRPSTETANGGFTLVELLIVIVVLGILAGITVFGVARFASDADRATDLANLAILNKASAAYSVIAPAGQGLSDLANDTARMNRLYQRGLLSGAADSSGVIAPKVPGAAFTWSSSMGQWQYSDSGITSYDLAAMNLSDYSRTGTWTQSSAGLTSGYGMMFVPNPRSEYTINVTATLSAGTSGGYGVLFNTSLNPPGSTTDTGYSLQFDRGYSTNSSKPNSGAIIIIPRTDGVEGAALRPVYTSTNTGGLVADRTAAGGPEWWAAQHSLTLKVTASSSPTSTLALSIDGQTVFDNFSFTNTASSANSYTGFRSWNKTPATYQNLSVS